MTIKKTITFMVIEFSAIVILVSFVDGPTVPLVLCVIAAILLGRHTHVLDCLWTDLRAKGGTIPKRKPASEPTVSFMASPGKRIVDPDEAEALGLAVDAVRMRRESGGPPAGRDWFDNPS